MRTMLMLSLAGCLGCEKPLTGTYVGTGTEKGKATVDVGPGSKPGEVIVNWWNTDRPRGNLEAKVESAGDKKLRVSFMGCGIVFDQGAAPNDHQGTVTMSPQQVCDVEIDHYKGPVLVSGTAQFDRKKSTLSLHLYGGAPVGSKTRVEWSLVYDGLAKQ